MLHFYTNIDNILKLIYPIDIKINGGKKKMNKLKRQNEGITLIALVVTIVILIILASISVNLVFKEDGLIDKAKQAKDMQINAQEQEDHTLNEIAKTIRKLHTR